MGGGKAAGDMIGRVERRRAGGDQADIVGDGGQCRQQREWLERGDGVAALERIDRHVEHGQMVGHEEGVELAGLELPDQLLDMSEIEIGVGPGAGIAPCAGVNRDRSHESAELELPLCHLPRIRVLFRLIGNRDARPQRHYAGTRRFLRFAVTLEKDLFGYARKMPRRIPPPSARKNGTSASCRKGPVASRFPSSSSTFWVIRCKSASGFDPSSTQTNSTSSASAWTTPSTRCAIEDASAVKKRVS